MTFSPPWTKPERCPATRRIREQAWGKAVTIIALTGTQAQVQRVARDFKVYSEKVPDDRGGYTIAHAAFTFVLGRDGQYREFVPPGTPSGRIAAVIEEALEARP